MTTVGSVTDETSLVGIDWGTSSLRLAALNRQGQTLATIESGDGISRVESGDFEGVLERSVQAWQLPVSVPLMLSGMIGSRNGWVEAPYLPAPAALASLANGLVKHQSRAGRALYFVPGVRLSGQRAGSGASVERVDVMRGEETELLGWFELNRSELTGQSFVLPGTHCKWVRVQDRQIADFQTCMTGELFATLCEHSILGRLMAPGQIETGDGPATDAFDRGVLLGLAEPASLLANLFSARSLPLLERMAAGEVRSYLAGLLIGTEVAGQIGQVAQPLVVIGRGELAERYVRALSLADVPASCAAPGSAIAGQFAIARMAGLVN